MASKARTAGRIALTLAVAALALPAAAAATDVHVDHDSTVVDGGGDGIVAPGDALSITESVRNSEPGVTLTGVQGTLTTSTSGVTVTQATSALPDFAFGDTSANTTAFGAQVADSPAVECGQNLGFSLALSSAQGTATVPFTVGTGIAGAPITHNAGDLPKFIPDGQQITSTFEVAAAGRVKDLSVTIGHITHTYDADLRISLISPDGTRVVLVDQEGGSGDDFSNTTLTADQGPPIASGSAPFTGTFTADGDLSRFVGKQQQGTWTLEVQDLTSSDVGTLDAWGAELSPATCAPQPVASFTATPNPTIPGQAVSFDASGTRDPVGLITKYEWDLDGDGTYETDTGTTPTTSHTYAARGAYPVSLRVTDDHNLTSTYTRVVSVSQPPTADFSFLPAAPSTGDEVSFDATASSDPDGAIAAYAWDLDGNGTYETDTGTTPSVTHVFATPGTHTVRLRVTDDDGATATKAATLDVANRPPVARIADPGVVVAGRTVTLDGGGSSDPDGSVTQWLWDLDDDGTFETDGGAAPTLDHTFTTPGSVTVGLKVLDADGAQATTTATFTVTNAPVAVITATPSTVRPGGSVDFSAAGSGDADGPLARYEWDLDGNGSFETDTGTTPSASKTYPVAGTYAVKLRVTDGDGATATATTTVSVVNQLPVATAVVSSGPAVTGVPVTLDASGSSDPDGSVVRYEWDLDGNGSYETDSGAAPTATRTYPNAGTILVKLRVTDNDGGTGTTTVPVAVSAPPSGTGTGTGSGTGTGTGPGTGSGTGTGTGGGAGGGPAGPGAGGLPATLTASLIGAPIQSRKLARRRGVTLVCQADRAARCSVDLMVNRRTARKLRLARSGRKAVRVGSATAVLARGGTATMVVRLSRKARRGLRRARRVSLLVAGTAVDATGHTVVLRRVVLLR